MFSIVMGADNSFYVKSIANLALTFFGYIISVLVSVVVISAPQYTNTNIIYYLGLLQDRGSASGGGSSGGGGVAAPSGLP